MPLPALAVPMAFMAAAAARDALNAVSTDDESTRQLGNEDNNGGDNDNNEPDKMGAINGTSPAPTRKIWSVRSIRSPNGFRNSSANTQRLFGTTSGRLPPRLVVDNQTQVLSPDQQRLLLWNGFVDGNFQQGKVHDLIIEASCWNFAYSPNQKVLVVGAGNLVQFYDTTSYLLFGQVEREGVISSLEWWMDEESNESSEKANPSSASFGYLAVGGLDGVATLYCMDMDLLEMQAPLEVHEYRAQGQVRAMSLSLISSHHDVKLLLWAVGDQEGQVTLSTFDAQQVSMIQSPTRVEHRESAIFGIAVSSVGESGPWCAIATKGGCLSVHAIQRQQQQGPGNEPNTSRRRLFASPSSWSLNSAVHYGIIPSIYRLEQRGPIRAVTFSKDCRLLACGGYDKTVVIIDTLLWASVYELTLEGTLNTIVFDPLDRYLAVGCRDKSFTVFDTSTWFPIKHIHTPGWVTCISWGAVSAVRDVVAVRGQHSCISIYDFTPIHIQTPSGRLHQPTFTPSKSSRVGGGGGNVEALSSLSWSRDGRFLARINGSRVILTDSHAGFEDVSYFKLHGTLRCVAFCPALERQDLLAVVGLNGYLSLLRYEVDEESNQVQLEIMQSMFVEDDLWVVAWIHDGSLLATGGKGKKLHTYKYEGEKLVVKDEPFELDGRVWDIKFMPSAVLQGDSKLSTCAMAVGSGDYTTMLFDINTFQPTLQIFRPRTVRCIAYHPKEPFLAVGDGAGLVAIVDFVNEETAHELWVKGRVNALEFSPVGDFLLVGTDDYRFTIHETAKYSTLQEVSCSGFALSGAFSATGSHLALGSANDDYSIVRLGPLLGIDLIPLDLKAETELPTWAVNEALYRSGYGPSFVQRQMINGSKESLQRVAVILRQNPDAVHAFNRLSGEGCFDTALALRRPNLLKHALTTLVDGTVEADGRRSILTTSLPNKARAALAYMIANYPPDMSIDVLQTINFVKVPFTEPRAFAPGDHKECGSTSYSNPWGAVKPSSRGLTRSNKASLASMDDGDGLTRTPAVLPLPFLGTMEFLSSIIVKLPATAFNNEAMALVLRVMWRRHIRRYFFIDAIVFIIFACLWILLIERTSSTTSTSTVLDRRERVVCVLVIVMNSLFAAKEAIQSDFGRRPGYLRSVWNLVDLLSIPCVYIYGLITLLSSDVVPELVPLAVTINFLMTGKFLSYLRGFNETGWLISVLLQNIRDVRGFMVVLLALVVGFSLSLRILFGNVPGNCNLGLSGADGSTLTQTCLAPSYGSIRASFFTTFQMTILGSYDPTLFNFTEYERVSIITFLLAATSVYVVALNALISVLADSYARVQVHATANRRRERAELIVEYMSLLPVWRRRIIENNTKYFHALLEADADGDLLIHKEDWQGGLNALRRDMEHMITTTAESNQKALDQIKDVLEEDLSNLKKQVVGMLQTISSDMKVLQKGQGQDGIGITFNAKNMAKAVKVVKSIGRKGAIWRKQKD